jgi:CheY-like chemotaxis protein
MEIGGLLISLALLVLVVAYVARPLVERQAQPVSESDRELSALQAERDRILLLLQDLEMDQAMGKISSEDYQAQRAPLVTRGAEVLRGIDQHLPPREIQAVATDALEVEIARRRASAARAVGYCTSCGNPLQAGDRFCIRCGAAAAVEVSA